MKKYSEHIEIENHKSKALGSPEILHPEVIDYSLKSGWPCLKLVLLKLALLVHFMINESNLSDRDVLQLGFMQIDILEALKICSKDLSHEFRLILFGMVDHFVSEFLDSLLVVLDQSVSDYFV